MAAASAALRVEPDRPIPDELLVERIRGGDQAAFEDLYGRYFARVHHFVARRMRNRADADETVQEVFVNVFASIDSFRGEAPFGAWVRQVAVRQCLMHLRSPWQRARRALRLAPEDADDDPAAVTAPQEAHEPPLAELVDLERALARLPGTARAVVWLYDVEGLRHEEIAALFGRSVSFSKSQLARAHALLRATLQGGLPARPAGLPADHLAAQGQMP